MAKTRASARYGKKSPRFGTLESARTRAQERRTVDAENFLITTIERSPYGGFTVRSRPVDVVIEESLNIGLKRPRASVYGNK